jgi:hypothetical protein
MAHPTLTLPKRNLYPQRSQRFCQKCRNSLGRSKKFKIHAKFAIKRDILLSVLIKKRSVLIAEIKNDSDAISSIHLIE